MAILRLLFTAFRLHPVSFGTDVVLQLARMMIPLVPPLIIKNIFTRYQEGVALNATTWTLILGLLGVSVIRIVVVVTATATDGRCRALIIDGLTRSAFKAALRRPAATPLGRPLGDVVNRLSADTLRVSEQAVAAIWVAGSVAQGLVALVVMIALNPRLSLAVVVPVVAGAGVVWISRSRAATLYQVEREAAGEVSQLISDVTSGTVAIQLAGTREQVVQSLREACERRRSAAVRSRTFVDVLLGVTMSNIAAIGTGLLLLIGAGAVGDAITAANLALLMAYLTAVVGAVTMVGGHVAVYKLSAVSATRLDTAVPGTVEGFADAEEDTIPHQEEPAEGFRELCVENLTCVYPQSGQGVRDVSFALRRGQLMVIIGLVGAGKTTLIRGLLGHLPRQGGRVLVNGEEQEVLQLPMFAYTPQRPGLVTESVKANILAGADDQPGRVNGAVWSSALERDVARMPDGVDTVVGPDVGLSGGQIQRVGLARMIAQGADVCVVDDPSSSLDRRTEREVWSRMLRHPEMTCIAVTYQRWILERADVVLVLDRGMVEAVGPWRQVHQNSATARRLFPRRPSSIHRRR